MLKQCLVHRKSLINTGWNYHRIIAGDELLLQVSARRKCCKSQFMHLYRGTPYRILIKVKKIVYVNGLGQICCSINEYNKWVKWLEFLSSVNLQRYQVRACTRTQFYLTLCNPSTIARQAPLSMDFPGKNTGVGYHFLLQGTFPTQGSNSHFSSLLHWQLDFFFFFFTTAPSGKPEGTKAEPQLCSVFPTEEQNCSFASDLASQMNKKCVYFTLGQNVYNSSRERWWSHGEDGP